MQNSETKSTRNAQTQSDEQMAKESRDNGKEFTEEALSEADRETLRIYRKTRSASNTARMLKRSTGGTRTSLHRIRDKFGYRDARELLGADAVAQQCGAGNVTSAALYELIIKQDFKCALTGRELKPEAAAVDHKEALANGGHHAIDNVQWLHKQVNAAKGTMTNSEFIAMCSEVVRENGEQH